MRGLFGIDAVVQDGVPWPVEINPRYTASMELLERSQPTLSLLSRHRAVFVPTTLHKDDGGRMEDKSDEPCGLDSSIPHSSSFHLWGKAILYACETFVFPADGPWLEALEPSVELHRSEYADIPHAGDVIARGHPVLTLFASAESAQECQAKLKEKVQALDRCLWG